MFVIFQEKIVISKKMFITSKDMLGILKEMFLISISKFFFVILKERLVFNIDISNEPKLIQSVHLKSKVHFINLKELKTLF